MFCVASDFTDDFVSSIERGLQFNCNPYVFDDRGIILSMRSMATAFLIVERFLGFFFEAVIPLTLHLFSDHQQRFELLAVENHLLVCSSNSQTV